jgi:hypothetical protein
MKASAICLAFLMLATIRAACQDTLCTTFIIDTVACNNQPYGGCSSHASVPGVIVDSTGVFGCMHPRAPTSGLELSRRTTVPRKPGCTGSSD